MPPHLFSCPCRQVVPSSPDPNCPPLCPGPPLRAQPGRPARRESSLPLPWSPSCLFRHLSYLQTLTRFEIGRPPRTMLPSTTRRTRRLRTRCRGSGQQSTPFSFTSSPSHHTPASVAPLHRPIPVPWHFYAPDSVVYTLPSPTLHRLSPSIELLLSLFLCIVPTPSLPQVACPGCSRFHLDYTSILRL